jgi:uncharacterized protein (DUF1697 family)
MLRGINVAGQKKVNMQELQKLYESLQFRKVQTYIQSGNVIFEHPDADIPNLSKNIERELKRRFGFDVQVIMRTGNELQKLIKKAPFAGKDEDKMYVTFLYAKPQKFSQEDLGKAKAAGEEFSVLGSEVYLFLPNGYGRTKLTNTFFERKLNVPATTRNWRTVNTLYSLTNQN